MRPWAPARSSELESSWGKGACAVQAGAHPVTWVGLAVELQRDWAREETVADIIEIVLTERLLKA